jgi:DNA-binding MarR family transcriptional regulator
MTAGQLGMLMRLSEEDDLPQVEFAERLEVDTTTIMVLCDSLEQRGWIQRVPDPRDRRVNRILLTDSGREAYRQALSLVQDGFDYMLKVTPVDEINRVSPFLKQLDYDLTSIVTRLR